MTQYNDALYDAIQAGEITADSTIEVDVFSGPIGGHGFRSGKWPVTINGVKFRMFSSIPHRLSLADQEARLVGVVETAIQRAIEGKTFQNKYNGGKTELSYSSNMERI